MTASSAVRKQIREFVIVWTFITLLIGAGAFFAIYFGTGALPLGSNTSIALPTATVTVAQVVQLPTSTPLPTREPTAEPTAEETEAAAAQAVAQADPATPTPAPTLLPVENRRFAVGIQVQKSPDGNDNIWMDLVADRLHMNWTKIQVRWENYELERGVYDYTSFEWVTLDNVMESAHSHGVNVMFSVVTAPAWAREQGVNLDRHGPPADPAAFANFLTVLLERYKGKVHAVEVWNEMNLDREWTSTSGLSASNYVTLLRSASEAIRAVDPGIIVISGALSPTGGFTDPATGVVGAIDDFVYFDALLAAGMLNYSDCVGAHHNGINVGPSYEWDAVPNDPAAIFRGPFDNPHHSWTFRSTLQTYAEKIQLAGSDQKLCVTEFGWASVEDMTGAPAGFDFAKDNTLAEQRDWTVEAVTNMEEWDIVWLAFLWNLNYGPQAGWDVNNDNVPYSIIGPNTSFRPVFDELAAWQLDYLERTGQQ